MNIEEYRKKVISKLEEKNIEGESKEQCDKKIIEIQTIDGLINFVNKVDPEMFSDIEFMSDLVNADLKYMELDETNSSEVGIIFLQKYKEVVKKMGFNSYEVEEINQSFDNIINELNNPRQVDTNKYKIPHKYLIEGIKRLMNEDSFVDDVQSLYEAYKRNDGLLSVDQGKKLEELYSNEEYYFYLHKIDYRNNYSDEEIRNIEHSICRDGLRLTTMGNEAGKIDYTTLNNCHKESHDFFRLLEYWNIGKGIIALQIPRSKIDNYEAVLGSNSTDVISGINPGIVLPKYVIGYIENSHFIENEVALEDRTQYRFLFSEANSKTSCRH